jgi:hypothetical protein
MKMITFTVNWSLIWNISVVCIKNEENLLYANNSNEEILSFGNENIFEQCLRTSPLKFESV